MISPGPSAVNVLQQMLKSFYASIELGSQTHLVLKELNESARTEADLIDDL